MMRRTYTYRDIQKGRRASPHHGPAAPSFFKSPQEPIETILNRLISKIDYGLKWKPYNKPAHPIHCNSKEELLAYYTHTLKDRYGNPKHWLSSLTHQKWNRHFSGQDTFYFTGATNAPYTLVMIDIDCHKKGSYAGAVKCAEFLKTHFFPGLFFEPSTNLNGVHGYFVLKSAGMRPEQVNDWEKKLQSALQGFQNNFDIELIEVKGHCHTLERMGRQTTNVTCGTLAKCPRTVRERKDDFLHTTIVDPKTFVMPQHQPQIEIQIVGENTKAKKASTNGSITGKCIQDWKKLVPLAEQMLGSSKGRVVGDVRVSEVVFETAASAL